jgi:hypothetical protein
MSNESKALELALTQFAPWIGGEAEQIMLNSAAELRRQHAEIESLRAQLAARVPDGWKLVPVEATREMLYIVGKPGEPIADMAASYRKDIWTAMLSAAPSQQATAQGEPMFWVRLCSDGMYEGPIHHKQIERVRQQSGAWTPLYTHPQQASEPMTDDQDRALCEAHFNEASEEYFKARPQLDSDVNRRIFYAGHRKAWIAERHHKIGEKQ